MLIDDVLENRRCIAAFGRRSAEHAYHTDVGSAGANRIQCLHQTGQTITRNRYGRADGFCFRTFAGRQFYGFSRRLNRSFRFNCSFILTFRNGIAFGGVFHRLGGFNILPSSGLLDFNRSFGHDLRGGYCLHLNRLCSTGVGQIFAARFSGLANQDSGELGYGFHFVLRFGGARFETTSASREPPS
jgi:hypothetical protein